MRRTLSLTRFNGLPKLRRRHGRWVCLFLAFAVAVSDAMPVRASEKMLAKVEVPLSSASDGLFLTPKGELVVLEKHSVVAIDAQGNKRTLVTDPLYFHPLASCGGRGFLVSEWESGAWPRAVRLIDWNGQTKWRIPKDAMRAEVSPDGYVCFPAAGSNFFMACPDGALGWHVPIETRAPWWSGFRMGNDNSIAFTTEISKRLVMMAADGTELWTKIAPWMDRGLFIERDINAGVILGGTNRLAAFAPAGQLRWDIPFPPKVPDGLPLPPGNVSGPTNLIGIAVDPRNYVYCQASDNRVYVLNERGDLQRAFARPANYSRQDEWITFNASADAMFITGQYRSIGKSFRINGRPSTEFVETNRRFVCLSKDGKMQWDVSLPGQLKWERPASAQDARYLLQTRMGSREMIWTRKPLISPDGKIFLWYSISGRQQAWVYFLQGDDSDRR